MHPLTPDKHDILTCQMCGESFTCFCNRPAACPCVQANVTRDEAEWISWQTGGECVCIACLMRLREAARQVLI